MKLIDYYYFYSKKWRWPFLKLSLRDCIVIAAITICLVAGAGYFHFSSLRSYKNKLRQKQQANEQLRQENLFYRSAIEPIRIRAEQFYPGLDTEAAIAKLAEDMTTVRELATRDVYRPLSADLKSSIVSALSNIRDQYGYHDTRIKIEVLTGSSPRLRVAEELIDIFRVSGFKTVSPEPSRILATSAAYDVLINFNPVDSEFVTKICKVVGRFIDCQFHFERNPNLSKGTLQFAILGKCLFLREGVVVFEK